MSIDLKHEQVISLSEACRLLPRRRRGRKPSPTTLWRWATHGLNGTRLEVLKVGGVTCTSVEALQRFCDRLTEQASLDKPAMATQYQQRETDAQLDLLGL